MKSMLISIGLFLLLTVNVSAAKFVKGNTYEGHIKNIFSKVLISLPPGEWTVTENNTKRGLKVVEFINYENDVLLYIGTSDNRGFSGNCSASKWSAESHVSKDFEAIFKGQYHIYSEGIEKKTTVAAYCIHKLKWPKDSEIYLATKAIAANGNGLLWYAIYIPIKLTNISSLQKKDLEVVGKNLINLIKNNINRKPGNYSEVKRLLESF